MYQGQSFFEYVSHPLPLSPHPYHSPSGWNFDTFPDPTNGNVVFQNQNDAFSKGLAFVQEDNTTVLAVDDTTTLPVGGNRDS